MSALMPNGTVFALATAFAAAVPMTAISNAKPGVVTTATPPAVGDVVLLSSGWPTLNDRVVRVANVETDSFELASIDTTDVSQYEPGQGVGSFVVASDFVSFDQVTASDKAGGEQQFFTWQYMEDRTNTQRQRPTYKNAKSLTINLDYDPLKPWYSALETANEKNTIHVLRCTLPNGGILYYPVYVSFDPDPSMTMNENMQNTATFSLAAALTRY